MLLAYAKRIQRKGPKGFLEAIAELEGVVDAGKLFPALAAKKKKVVAPSIILQTGKTVLEAHGICHHKKTFDEHYLDLVECSEKWYFAEKTRKYHEMRCVDGVKCENEKEYLMPTQNAPVYVCQDSHLDKTEGCKIAYCTPCYAHRIKSVTSIRGSRTRKPNP
jgi:hypothetical protein